jgi:hypothetical protein
VAVDEPGKSFANAPAGKGGPTGGFVVPGGLLGAEVTVLVTMGLIVRGGGFFLEGGGLLIGKIVTGGLGMSGGGLVTTPI